MARTKVKSSDIEVRLKEHLRDRTAPLPEPRRHLSASLREAVARAEETSEARRKQDRIRRETEVPPCPNW